MVTGFLRTRSGFVTRPARTVIGTEFRVAVATHRTHGGVTTQTNTGKKRSVQAVDARIAASSAQDTAGKDFIAGGVVHGVNSDFTSSCGREPSW